MPLVRDNYGTHKTAEVQARLAKHRRFYGHFTPTSPSWLNRVERFFAELEQAIRDYLDHHNAKPKPCVWTKSAEVILAKEARAKAALDAIKTSCPALESER